MKAAKFDVTADRVRPNRRWEQSHELRSERGHRRTEHSPRGGSAARDLIEAGGLREHGEERGGGEANEAPAAEPQAEDDADHDGSALGLGSPKKLRKNSSRLGSVLTRSITREPEMAWSSASKLPWIVHLSRWPSTVRSSTPSAERKRSAGTSSPGANPTSTWWTRMRVSSPSSATLTSRPARRMPTLSHTCSTSDRTCDERKMVAPPSRVSRSSS